MTESGSTSESSYIIGNYIIGERIGEGGFGKVYKAQHMYLDRQVCIKLVPSNDANEDLENTLSREAQVLNTLKHKNIVYLHDLIIKNNQIAMVMDYIDGGDLAATLKNASTPLSFDEVDRIIEQIAEGLHYAHQQHIIHRDLKPHNILLRKDGNVVIADFGLAKVIDTARSQSFQSLLSYAGTPAYMAPEHFAGQADYSSDLYSLGVIAYQLLTKQLPFGGGSQAEEGHRHKAPPPLRDFNSKLSPEIEQVVLKMLAKKPQERYESPLEFARALHSAIAKKALKAPRVNPDTIDDWLPSFADGQVISLDAGEYQGPFTIEKSIHLIGAGPLTKVFAIDQPVFHILAPDVCLENMVIQRTPENIDEPAIKAEKDVTYTLRHVTIQGGQTEEAQWQDAEWQLPVNGVDLGHIPVESKLEQAIAVEVKDECTVETDVPGLAVFPALLSPGPHELSLEYNASGKLPGTLLNGKISLRSQSEVKIIAVTGQIEQLAAVSLPEEGPSLTSIEVSYHLQDKAAQNLLRKLGSDEDRDLIKQWEVEKDRRLRRHIVDHAHELLFELVGQNALLWYVRRSRVNRENEEEEIWEWTVATDASNSLEIFTTYKSTLRLICNVHREGRGKPRIIDVHFPKIEMGRKDLASLSILLKWVASAQGGIPQELIEQMRETPIESPRELDRDQLQGWEDLLEFQLNQFKKRQYWARYTGHNYRNGSSKVTFSLDKDDLKDGERNTLSYQEFQERTRKTKKELHLLFPTLPDGKKGERNPKGRKIGILDRFNSDAAEMTIHLEQTEIDRLKNNPDDLPGTGYLYFDAYGDVQQIERQQRAIADLQQGRSLNRALSDFFFDANKARRVPVTKHLETADLLSGTCNNGQISAIEAALATPDLLLLQGPPGTGKTTVIAEICYQVAQNGGRTLIASQSNLAVDNALGRLVHKPSIRALRKGNADSVEDEGRDFTEERVVQKWLTNTADDCQLRLEARQKNIALFKTLLNDSTQFSRYASDEAQWEKNRSSLQHQLDTVVVDRDGIEASMEKNREEVKKHFPIHNLLSSLVAGTTDWQKPDIESILKDSYQYILETGDKQQFRKNIHECLRLAGLLGLAFPTDGHLLRGMVWLKGMVHASLEVWTESGQSMNQIETAITEMSTNVERRKKVESVIQEKKAQMSSLALLIDPYQNTLQDLSNEITMIQRAVTSYQDRTGRNSLLFQDFINRRLQYRSAASLSQNTLTLEQLLSKEMIIVVQRDPSAAFFKVWSSIERVIETHIQQVAQDIANYKQTADRLSNCRQRFSQMVYSQPEIKSELERVGYTSTSAQTNSFSRLIEQIESSLYTIQATLTKAPSIFGRLSGERDKKLLEQFLEARNLFIIAAQAEEYIPDQQRASSVDFADKQAAKLSSFAQQWIAKQDKKAQTAYHSALEKKNQLEAEQRQVQQLLMNEEARLQMTLKMIEEQSEELAKLFQNLSRADLPENLRLIAQKYARAQASFLPFLQDDDQLYKAWMNDTQSLRALIDKVWHDLTTITEKIQAHLTQTRATLEQQRRALDESRIKQDELKQTLGRSSSDLLSQRSWWKRLWETIPENLRPPVPEEGIYSPPFLATMEKQFEAWSAELTKEEQYAHRYDRLVTDWVTRLRNLSESDKQDLRSAYLKNANVIGITCGQVYKLSYSENRDISKFEVVIIDEVSKATPPEILLPALKGKKLILIGDQRQLPPMIEDKTLDQLAEESGQGQQAYRYLNRPYFAQLYEQAPDEIKRMLYIQYRMHPDIMAAINQFYNRPLECGLNQPDIQRNHQLESALVRKNKHLIWISTPLVPTPSQDNRSRMISARNRMSGQSVFSYQSEHSGFGEQSSGTSQINYREVEIIKKICEELQRLWAPKVAAGAEPKEIGVITFYGAQTALLQNSLVRESKGMFNALSIRIGTVDRFQGIERAIVIVSMVRNNRHGEIGFARKDERINVAFSRSQELLIIVGCHDLFCGTVRQEEAVERYSNVAKVVRNRGDFIDISSI